MINNTPEIKLGIVAVSRDCFPNSLSENRRKAVVKAYDGEIYECPIIVENEIDMMNALEDLKKAECDALVVYLGNFGPETEETLLVKYFDGPCMVVAAAEETGDDLVADAAMHTAASERKLQPETAQPARIHSGVPGWRCRRRSSHDQRFRTGCNCSCSC